MPRSLNCTWAAWLALSPPPRELSGLFYYLLLSYSSISPSLSAKKWLELFLRPLSDRFTCPRIVLVLQQKKSKIPNSSPRPIWATAAPVSKSLVECHVWSIVSTSLIRIPHHVIFFKKRRKIKANKAYATSPIQPFRKLLPKVFAEGYSAMLYDHTLIVSSTQGGNQKRPLQRLCEKWNWPIVRRKALDVFPLVNKEREYFSLPMPENWELAKNKPPPFLQQQQQEQQQKGLLATNSVEKHRTQNSRPLLMCLGLVQQTIEDSPPI